MLYLLLSLVALGLISALIGYISYRRGDRQEIIKAQGDCTSCSGSNAMCEQECTMKAATEPIEYFDDEELDTFRGRPSDSYTEEETQQFADVLETLQPNEVEALGAKPHPAWHQHARQSQGRIHHVGRSLTM